MNELQKQILLRRSIRIEMSVQTVPDKRYRCLVTLIRSDRPRYWYYLCSNCGARVAQILNQEVYSTDDFFDPQNINNTAIGRDCKGELDGVPCNYTYLFHSR